ncbi:hypothetical protein [Deinococcus gobiensis]|uniref:Uncharacterized protein n=1 Tax=Deinococcus gobiensis (strain DSM 21396 / JCM 16679 / CGMCC 1.7299 / I-0) TaxID=745776 RepID=H8H1V4_DEIGI|nr:hypothetical protein [Deinococcus gobiensis]AFD27501.1 hypothetical protein DGo_PB0232 [Deinococcus gobiensis I-0]
MTQHTPKQEHWILQRQLLLAAVQSVQATDIFTELLRQVQNGYVRLTDAETLRLMKACWTGSPESIAFAQDMLLRNALPILLQMAYEYSTRFGGLHEAFDGALHRVKLLLPSAQETEKGVRHLGWNGEQGGIRWLTWVEKKLRAELPSQAERFVDDKKESATSGWIAAGRNQLFETIGNHAALYVDGLWSLENFQIRKTRPTKSLPAGRRNLVVKRGATRLTRKALGRSTSALTANLMGKAPLALGEKALTPQPHTSWWAAMDTLRGDQARWEWLMDDAHHLLSHLPVTPEWVAAAIRAKGHELLRQPRLAERTLREAQRRTQVTAAWVNRNSKTTKLDALVGDDQDERLMDIIAAPEAAREFRFEAELHRSDKRRAFNTLRRYGPVHGPVLLALDVRSILPTHRRRLSERRVREAFTAFCERSGIPTHGTQAIAAARVAAQMAGLAPKASSSDVRMALMGVQDALRGRKPVKGRVSVLGSALSGALAGTRLQVVSHSDQEIATALRRQFPKLKFGFSLAAAFVFGRKLDRQGKADRVFVEACRKAGVRIKLAEDALNLLHDVPVTSRQGERVRVQGAKGYLRPWQLAIEAEVHRVERWATQTRQALPQLDEDLLDEQDRAASVGGDTQFLGALSDVEVLRASRRRTSEIADLLAAQSERLEEAAQTVNLTLALNTLLDADALEYEALCAANHQTWWAQAYVALDHAGCPF